MGFAVFSIKTAHCISVVGGWSVGTTGSACRETIGTEGINGADGAGSGSANSVQL